MNAYIAGTKTLSAQALKNADVYQDGLINDSDTELLSNHVEDNTTQIPYKPKDSDTKPNGNDNNNQTTTNIKVPDTGLYYNKYIYIIGIITLSLGAYIIYKNMKVKSK